MEAQKSKTLQWIVVLFFMIGFGFLPPFGQVTQVGMHILGIFIGAVYGWTVIGILGPTLIAITCYIFVVGAPTYLQSSFGIAMVAMLLVLFPICGMLNKYNVVTTLAQKFITSDFCEGHPWRLCFMILLGAYICVNVNVLVAAVIFIEFLRNICKVANLKTPSKFSVAMMTGIALCMMTGQLMIPVHGTPLVLIGALTSITGTTVNMAKYMLLVIPMSIVLIVTYLACMKFILKVDVEPLKVLTAESLGGKAKFNKDQIKALGIMVVIIAALVSTVAIPASAGAAYTILNGKLGLFGIVMIAACVLLFFKDEQGKPMFNFAECAKLGMAWEPLFLVAFIIPFSQYMTGGDTGISATLASIMRPLFGLSPLVFLVVMYLCVNIITNFAQNTVVVIIFMPLFMAYGAATGFDMSAYYILLFLVAQLALASPGSSTLCGILYSAGDIVDTKMILKNALMVMPFLFIVLMVVGMPLSLLLF